MITGATTGAGEIERFSVAFPVPPEFVALITTDELPAVVGVPAINPVVEFTLSPAGRPAAPNEVALLLAVI